MRRFACVLLVISGLGACLAREPAPLCNRCLYDTDSLTGTNFAD